MKRRKGGRLLFALTEWIALFAVMHCCIWRFLESTTFRFEYSQGLQDAGFYALIGAAVLRGITGTAAALREAASRKDKAFAVIRPLLCAAAIVPCALTAGRFGYDFLIYLPLAALCLYGTDAERALKVFAGCIGGMLAATALCALSGAIRNLVYLREDTGAVRTAYGISFPTDLAAYLLYLLAVLSCCARRSSWLRTGALCALTVFTGWWMNAYTDSRNSALCALLLAAGMLFLQGQEAVISRHPGARWVRKVTDGAMTAAFPVMGAAFAGLTWMYGRGSSLAFRVNELLSNRLYQAWTAFEKYGIHGLGALTPQSGLGGRILYDPSAYEFLDSSYALLLIRYGWVIALMTAAVWVWMTRKAIRTGHRRIALALAVIAVHSFAEHHLPEINFNLLLVMPLCAFPRREEESAGKPVSAPAGEGRKAAAGWIAFFAVGGVFLALLPRMLSRARSLFGLIGWQDLADWSEMGEKALKPMLGWLLVLFGLAAAWFALRRLLRELFEGKRPAALTWGLLAAVGVAACGGALWVNRHMDLKQPEAEARIAADEGAVRRVLEAAEDPVWAGQYEELYRERFGGIAWRLFSPEELARTCRGSVIMEHDRECIQLLNTGARYAELSPYSGIFTWDEAVIGALSAAGYNFRDYYYAEREMDFAQFSAKNELDRTPSGGLILRGWDHSLKSGPYLEQYAGEYTVTYTLHLPDPHLLETDQEICVLRVVTGYGRELLTKKGLFAEDFDPEGNATVSLSYHTEDARGQEYLAFPHGENELWVERIVWKRDS